VFARPETPGRASVLATEFAAIETTKITFATLGFMFFAAL
jgi:hypothetical protein